MGIIKLHFTFSNLSVFSNMSNYKAFENEQLTNANNTQKSGAVPLKWFALAAVGCVGAAAIISYARFSAPGARADFQEGNDAINPKFRDAQLKYVEVEDVIVVEEEVETTTTTATATHQYTETIQSDDDNSIPTYLQGYGETFVYHSNPPQQQQQVASNQAYQASYAADVGSGDAEGVTGSGDGYYQVDLSSPAQPVHASSIACWTCNNAANWAECANRGTLVQCEESATSCELEIRRRDGAIEQINTGCKQREACENNKSQNYESLDYTDNNQCRPDEDEGPSVCRQCCHANNCNYMLDFIDLDGWRQELY